MALRTLSSCAELLGGSADEGGVITVGVAGVVADDVDLSVPLCEGEKIVLDLTPGADDWLRILAANAAPMKHHEMDEAEALHLAVQLSESDAYLLLELDKKISCAYGYSAIKSPLPWIAMTKSSGKTVVNLILRNSEAPTRISVLKDEHVLTGSGAEFLNDCLKGRSLADFMCKAIVELECINKGEAQIGVMLSLHHLVLTPVPKRTRVEYSESTLEAALISAKKLKYRF